MKTSPKKNERVEKDGVMFGVKVTVEFEFDFESFSTLHIEHVALYVKMYLAIFNKLIAFQAIF